MACNYFFLKNDKPIDEIDELISYFRFISNGLEEMRDCKWLDEIIVECGEELAQNPDNLLTRLRIVLALLQMKHLPRYPDTVVQAFPAFKTVSKHSPSNAELANLFQQTAQEVYNRNIAHLPNEILAKIFKEMSLEDCMAVDLCLSAGMESLHEHASNSNEEDPFLMPRCGPYLEALDLVNIETAEDKSVILSFCGPNLQPCSCFSPSANCASHCAPKNVYSLELQRDLVLDAFLREISSHGNLRYVRVECVLHLDLICEIVRSCKNLTHIGWLWHTRNEVAAGLQPLFDALDEANANSTEKRTLNIFLVCPRHQWRQLVVSGAEAPCSSVRGIS
uniref:F-box domain-containing protein n=1 Tax=Ditylenchus dipsaci TaxID=166011 RepID=A0A915EW22_9BILA